MGYFILFTDNYQNRRVFEIDYFDYFRVQYSTHSTR